MQPGFAPGYAVAVLALSKVENEDRTTREKPCLEAKTITCSEPPYSAPDSESVSVSET